MAARPLTSLPGLVLAWTLAFLIAPALASACTAATTTTYTGADGGDWATGTNWDNGAPDATDDACVPIGLSVVVSANATVGDIEVEGTLNVSGAQLTVGPLAGSLVSGTVAIDSTGSLDLGGGTDVGGGGVIANAGTLGITGNPGTDTTVLTVALNNNGVVTNSVPVQVLGGGSGDGDWKLGSISQAGDPSVTIDTLSFQMNGDFTDADSGSQGHLVIGGTTLTMVNTLTKDPHIHVHQFDLLTDGATLDLSPIPAGTSSVTVDNLLINNGTGLFEVNAPLTVNTSLVMNAGKMLLNGPSSVASFQWGGGDIQSGNGSGLTVQNLDMSADLPGSAAHTTGGSLHLVTESPPSDTSTLSGATATFTLNGTTVFKVDAGAEFWVDGDIDIAGAGASVINNGTIRKTGGAATTGSHIAPALTTANGRLAVGAGSALILNSAPDTFDGSTNTLSGDYVLDGELVIPATVNTFAGTWKLGPGGTITQTLGGTSIFDTLTSNGPGSTITVTNAVQFTQDFINQGTLDVQAGGTFQVAAGKAYLPASGSTTKLSDPTSQLVVDQPIDFGAGSTLSGTGHVFSPTVTNSGGTVSPGNSPGTLTINGNFVQNGTGLLHEEIDGPAPGQFDKLVVLGTATLGGTLAIASTNGYQAPDTTQFQIVDAAGGVAGAWDGVIQTPFFPYLEQIYAPNTMVLIANSVSVGDVTVNEGNDAVFTVSLGQASQASVSVDWATQDGSAVAGSDYTAAGGTVTFAPGETTKTVTVAVTADGQDEPSENFAVNLSNPVNTRIRDANGVGTIGATATTAQVPRGDIDGFLVAPPPIQGKAVNVEPVSGTVLVKLPGATKFVALPDAEQVPVGTIVDARKGRVRLFSVGKGGRIQSAEFYEGMFQVTQKAGQALTVLKLFGGSFAGCPKPKAASAAAKRRKGTSSVRHLWGSGSGEFRTAGRYASATIRGTRWLTDDRCNGTLIRVTIGSVTVRDQTLNKTFALKKPKSYLAPAVKPKKRR